MVLKIIIIAFLLYLLYQDLRYRAIYWLSFPVLLTLILILGWHRGIEGILINGGINLMFFLGQLLLLTLYFSLKHRKPVNITHNLLGWGDILFLITIVFCFSPFNYVLFYIFSLLLVLILTILVRFKNSAFKVPLAGLQAGIFAILLFVDWNSQWIDLTSDDWLFNILVI